VLGHFPTTSLASARLDLQSMKSIRKEGRCPATEQRAAKQEAVKDSVVQSMTIKRLVDLYLEEYIEDRRVDGKLIPGARKKKGQSEVRRTLYNDVIPAMGGRLASDVTRKDIVDMVMTIVGRGSNVQAGNVLRELTAAYEYAIGLEKFEDSFANPALLAKESLRRARVRLSSERGKRVLSEGELKQFLQWLPGSVFTPTQKNVMRFTLWTGCRTGEVCEAMWKDVDLEKGVWQLNDTKTGIDRTVQLPTQAVTFLEQLKLVTGDCLFGVLGILPPYIAKTSEAPVCRGL
jgi:integrase